MGFLVCFTGVVHADASFGRRPSRNGFTGTLHGGNKVRPVIHVVVVVVVVDGRDVVKDEQTGAVRRLLRGLSYLQRVR